ncbi:MAG: amidohydrolase family protein, partial [Clostridiales Family XIII bacterium]|nr:amidohydrolase family protein [Clostridiales Family XIII bacterium]
EAQFDEVRARGGDPKDFRVTTVKFFADGVVEGKTAFLKEPYAGEPDTGARRGEPIWDTARLAEAFRAVTEAGLQIHVHAIGDAAVAQALDALEACTADGARAAASRPYVPSAGCCDGARAGQAPHLRAAASRPYNPSQGCRPYVPLRPVLTHLHVVDPGDFPRFAQLGVVASFQPFWHFKEPGWYDEIEAGHLGAARAENAYPVASLTAHGVRVTFSGDYPASPVNDPFFAIDAAVTRNLASGAPYDTPDIGDPDDPRWLRGAHERIPLAQAIEAYTIHGAYQLFREDDIGSLAPGKYADFLVLDRDPFALPPQDLDKVRVAETYRAGVLAAG